jgi:AcrR family transcriptional regulator
VVQPVRPSDALLGMPGGLRKRPLQDRSRVAIQRVLDTAEELVLELGAEAVVGSANLLLEKSGISRGSFYSFFETPQAVLDELALQCLQDSAADFTTKLANRDTDSWHGILDALIDSYNTQFRIPLVRELWVRQQLTSTVRELDRAWIDKISLRVLNEFRRHTPLFDDMALTQCVVPIESLERSFQYAYRSDPEGDIDAIMVARDMVESYWRTCAVTSLSRP